nr:hypothetical protein [Tanacetum cinerariifolium]
MNEDFGLESIDKVSEKNVKSKEIKPNDESKVCDNDSLVLFDEFVHENKESNKLELLGNCSRGIKMDEADGQNLLKMGLGSTTLMTLKGCKSSDGMMDCEEDQKGHELCEDIVDDSSEIEEDSDCVMVLDETCKEDVSLGSHIVVALIDVSSFSPIGIALVCENKGIDAAIHDLDDYRFSEYIHDGDDLLNQPKITCVDKRVTKVLSPRHSKTTNLDNIKRGEHVDVRARIKRCALYTYFRLGDLDKRAKKGEIFYCLEFDARRRPKKKRTSNVNFKFRSRFKGFHRWKWSTLRR